MTAKWTRVTFLGIYGLFRGKWKETPLNRLREDTEACRLTEALVGAIRDHSRKAMTCNSEAVISKQCKGFTADEQISREVRKYPSSMVCTAPYSRCVRFRLPKNPALRIAPGFGTLLANSVTACQ